MTERASILPEGEPLRRAVRWLADRRLADPAASLRALVEEASLRFDLTPFQEEFLLNQWAGELAAVPRDRD